MLPVGFEMGRKFLFLVFVFYGALACEKSLDCEQCVSSQCTYVITRQHEHLCVENSDSVPKRRNVIADLRGCAVGAKLLRSK